MYPITAFRRFAAGVLFAAAAAATPAIPPLSVEVPLAKQAGRETAVFAGGCFWGVQSVFQRVKGVISTAAGTRAEARIRPPISRDRKSVV